MITNATHRAWLVALGVGMGILWIVGLGALYSTPAITWLDFAGAILSFVGAAGIQDNTLKRSIAAGVLLLSLGVFGVWLGALLTVTVPWQTWWNFAFGCAYLVLGIAAAMASRPGAEKITHEEETTRRAA